MVAWQEIASCWELQWRWRRLQVGRKREAEEVGGLRRDKVIDGRKGARFEMVAPSHDPHGMPGKGASEGIEHFELTSIFLVVVRDGEAACRRVVGKHFMGRHSPPFADRSGHAS